jgi:hypothetical protein
MPIEAQMARARGGLAVPQNIFTGLSRAKQKTTDTGGIATGTLKEKCEMQNEK